MGNNLGKAVHNLARVFHLHRIQWSPFGQGSLNLPLYSISVKNIVLFINYCINMFLNIIPLSATHRPRSSTLLYNLHPLFITFILD